MTVHYVSDYEEITGQKIPEVVETKVITAPTKKVKASTEAEVK